MSETSVFQEESSLTRLDRCPGWTHYYAKASLPIKLNCRATLTPNIGFNGGMDNNALGFESSDSLDALGTGAGGGDVLHSGISLSVSF